MARFREQNQLADQDRNYLRTEIVRIRNKKAQATTKYNQLHKDYEQLITMIWMQSVKRLNSTLRINKSYCRSSRYTEEVARGRQKVSGLHRTAERLRPWSSNGSNKNWRWTTEIWVSCGQNCCRKTGHLRRNQAAVWHSKFHVKNTKTAHTAYFTSIKHT